MPDALALLVWNPNRAPRELFTKPAAPFKTAPMLFLDYLAKRKQRNDEIIEAHL
jgi:hypothetical protein